MNDPKIMFIRTTENCNAACFMCNYARESNGKILTKKEFEDLLEIMKNGNYKLIKFSGGEPLLHKDLEFFINRSKIEGYYTSIITNGYLLRDYYKRIIDAGLNHITISLDSNKPGIHDKIRGLNGLYDRIIESIDRIKDYNNNVKIRINTVGSYLNIFDLPDMYDLLNKLHVDQWVITPLKSKENYWKQNNEEEYYGAYLNFQERIKDNNSIQLLGYTKEWAGRNKEEFNNLINNNKLYRPIGKCYLVDKLRFYIPSKKLIVPCNSVSHRIEEIKIIKDDRNNIAQDADKMADWLKENGPKVCTGCGPINVWLAENPDLIEEDVFLF